MAAITSIASDKRAIGQADNSQRNLVTTTHMTIDGTFSIWPLMVNIPFTASCFQRQLVRRWISHVESHTAFRQCFERTVFFLSVIATKIYNPIFYQDINWLCALLAAPTSPNRASFSGIMRPASSYFHANGIPLFPEYKSFNGGSWNVGPCFCRSYIKPLNEILPPIWYEATGRLAIRPYLLITMRMTWWA